MPQPHDNEVVAVEAFKGLAVLKLRSLDGHALKHGDSGGGVWLRGELVGNTWATLVEAELDGEGNFTEVSLAAVYAD